MADENKVLTFGEKAVGLTFNPSNNEKVDKVKKAYAEVIDLLHKMTYTDEQGGQKSEKNKLINQAIRSAQGAQMWAVKAITWED